MVHGFDQIANACNLRSSEVPQIVNADMLQAKGCQRDRLPRSGGAVQEVGLFEAAFGVHGDSGTEI
jgi:hypothetical protein